MSEKEVKSVGRRDFFRKAGVGALGAAAVGLTAAEAGAASPASSSEGSGYRETEHVKKYYELARF